jgi:hypothetical protein
MYYLYVQRFEISCCFCLHGMIDTECDFKTKRPKISVNHDTCLLKTQLKLGVYHFVKLI